VAHLLARSTFPHEDFGRLFDEVSNIWASTRATIAPGRTAGTGILSPAEGSMVKAIIEAAPLWAGKARPSERAIVICALCLEILHVRGPRQFLLRQSVHLNNMRRKLKQILDPFTKDGFQFIDDINELEELTEQQVREYTLARNKLKMAAAIKAYADNIAKVDRSKLVSLTGEPLDSVRLSTLTFLKVSFHRKTFTITDFKLLYM
jgi:hypothetical protein